MADTNHDDGVTAIDLGATMDSDSNGGLRTTDELAVQKRTRSQVNVPDLILRLPLSRSPLKDARKARAKACGTSPTVLADCTPIDSQSHQAERGEAGPTMSMDEGTGEAVHNAEVEEEMDVRADGEGEEESRCLFSKSTGRDADSNSDRRQHTTSSWPANTKKRPSPDLDAIRALSSPSSERQPKRTKVEAFQILDRRQEHSEYREPLRDPESPSRPKGYKRASSTKPMSSPGKVMFSTFPPRAQSVPLGGEMVRSIDFAVIPPSPRRSPSKGVVEVWRAPSVPPLDEERMDVDINNTLALNPSFRCAVNFATPRGSAIPKRSGRPFPSPPSPLTPLPSSPPLFTNSDRVTTSASVDATSVPGRLDSSAKPRLTVVGAMRPKRRPSVLQGPKRVTRSVSMKEKRMEGDADVENGTAEGKATTTLVAGPSTAAAVMPPVPTTITFQPRLLKSTDSVNSMSRPPLATQGSVSKLPTDSGKLRQTSLKTFVKPTASPSKIPLPALPSKRPITPQPENFKSPPLLVGPTTGMGMAASRGTSGRSLSTLSSALDKLVVPAPTRPNTSMGFVKADGTSEGDNSPENGKGKGKAKDDTSLLLGSTSKGSGTFARPTASSLKRTATVAGFGSTVAARMQGRGGMPFRGLGRGRGTIGIFNKVGERASKKTSLPVVAGSPVKGSGVTDGLDRNGRGADKYKANLSLEGAKNVSLVTGEEDMMQDVSAEPSTGGGEYTVSQKSSPPTGPKAGNGIDIDLTVSLISEDKGKQRAVLPSTLNPASSALHALSESLSSLPHTPTPPKPRVAGTRTGLRSSAFRDSPVVDGSGIAGPTENHEVHGSGGAGPSSGTVNGSGGVKKSSLKILKRCAIFVDVRTEQGDDAGSLFVDMLKGLGAKIMGRLGQRCTHIVYKNGNANTLMRYRMLDDPKPCIVGIAWVVECAEKRAKVDEERFKIDVDLINVAGGTSKRRRSMFSKHLIPASPGPDYEMPLQMSSEADEDDEGAGGDGSPSQDPDLSIRSREEEDLPPLERARRRRSILPGGQTRLIP